MHTEGPVPLPDVGLPDWQASSLWRLEHNALESRMDQLEEHWRAAFTANMLEQRRVHEAQMQSIGNAVSVHTQMVFDALKVSEC